MIKVISEDLVTLYPESESQTASSEPVNYIPDNLSLELSGAELIKNGQSNTRTHLGPEVLLRMKSADVLNLIDTLLTTSANSEGIALYLWYVKTKSVDKNFHLEFLTIQRRKFGSNCTTDFIWDLMTSSIISSDPLAQFFTNNLTDMEISDLAFALFESWAGQKIIRQREYTGSLFDHSSNSKNFTSVYYPSRPGSERIYNNLIHMLWSQPTKVDHILKNVHSETPTFAGLLIKESVNYVTTVMDYYRCVFPQPDTKGHGAVFINNLMHCVNKNPKLGRLIMQQLELEEILSLLKSRKISYATVLGSLPVGRLPYAEIGRLLHAHSTVTIRRNHNEAYEAIPQNTLVGQIPAGEFADLARDLVLYRAKRDHIPFQQHRFMGIFGGISKNEKFTVVDKILTFVYGTEDEKQKMGAFTPRELIVMNQGELGKVILTQSASMMKIISLASKCDAILPEASALASGLTQKANR